MKPIVNKQKKQIAHPPKKEPKPYASKFLVDLDDMVLRETFSISPVRNDKYFRYLMRKLTKHAFLYTELFNEHFVC